MLIEVAGMTTEWHWCSFLNMGLHYFFRVDKKENKACERMQNEPCHFLMSSMMFRTVNSDVCWSQWSCLQTERSVLDAVCSGFDLPCTEEAPTCLETCGRMRECGRHRCMEHCHVGPCSTVCLHNLTDTCCYTPQVLWHCRFTPNKESTLYYIVGLQEEARLSYKQQILVRIALCGSEDVRIDQLRFLARCHTRRLNQA